MKKAIVIEEKDIKELIAKKYDVEEKDIIKSKYSYIIIQKEEEEA
jgi:hypothetical protein